MGKDSFTPQKQAIYRYFYRTDGQSGKREEAGRLTIF